MGHDLRHLGVQPLAHFGAAMVQMHRPVGIDMDQRPGLVEEGRVEGDAELHRGQRDAAPDHAVRPVEGFDLGAPGGVVRAFGQFADNILQHAILDQLAVGRAPLAAIGREFVRIEIAPAHQQRVDPQMMRHLVHHPFDADHALRPAKAAEGGVRLGVRLAAMRDHPHVRNVIGVVGMAHGARRNRLGQVP